jgi:hypothetical protein
MLPMKIEIKLKKEEPGSWNKLEISQKTLMNKSNELYSKSKNTSQMDVVDLSDI